MNLRPEDISIGVTLFRRLDYLEEALDSAVNQTVPVKVNLYDDGCQDQAGLYRILSRFGDRLRYYRNAKTLGLFPNMNQCIWNSSTPWVSVLHDDDALARDFVERILDVAPAVDACSLFCGGTLYMNKDSQVFHRLEVPTDKPWRKISAEEFAWRNWFSFPGQLINVAAARDVGGFPAKSIYTGDWDLWFRLTKAQGTVQLSADLARYRVHLGADRGTTTAAKTGRKIACSAAQAKRNLARLRTADVSLHFDRIKWLSVHRPLYRDLLIYSWNMPNRLLWYNRQLLLLARPPGRKSHLLHWVSKLLGNPGIRLAGLARTLGERIGFKMPQTF
jgi:glycosyltransferase involved in cell wall biosynthesis